MITFYAGASTIALICVIIVFRDFYTKEMKRLKAMKEIIDLSNKIEEKLKKLVSELTTENKKLTNKNNELDKQVSELQEIINKTQ